MKCPFCGNQEDHVLDSRPAREGAAIRRRRECLACGRRFTTFEEIEERRLMVVKRDGSRESYDRNKVLEGVYIACNKLPISAEQIEDAADDVERTLMNRLEPEVTSSDIGDLVMEQLLKLDAVAYVRFASVYRQFEDASEFRELVESIRKRKRARS